MTTSQASQRRGRLLASYMASPECGVMSKTTRALLAGMLEQTEVGRRTTTVEQLHILRRALDDIAALRVRPAKMVAARADLRAAKQKACQRG